MLRKLPVQPAGWVVFGIGVVSLLGALLLNWRELLVLAIGCGTVLVLSLAFVIGRSEIRLERHLASDRVSVGDEVAVELRALNSGSVRTNPQTILEAIDREPVAVPLPALAPGIETTVTWNPPTNRRGKYQLGPARITKTDPCKLMQRDVGETGADEFWVQPRAIPLPSFTGGLAKDVDGPTFDHSPAGDVAFHAIRPYQPGDDARHVHWMATARAGEMMVKQYVDNRQPHVTVLLDNDESSWSSPEEFDVGVEIAASLGVSSLDASQPGSVFVGSEQLVGSRRRSTRRLLLDDLTLVGVASDFDLADAMGSQVRAERNTTIAVIVTGDGLGPAELQVPVSRLAQTCAVLLVQVSATPIEHENMVSSRGVRSLNVTNLDDFAAQTRARVAA